VPAVAFEPQDEDYRVVAPVELSVDVRKTGDDVFRLTGRVTATLELECGRCVEPFTIPVDASFDLRYVPQTANKGAGQREIGEDDLATAYYRDGVLDLVELVREQFQLALPMKPLHDEACRGLCPECGANLNRTDCGHSPTWEDPRLAALKGLLTRDRDKE
jgi:uncharacterized protein